MEPWLLSFLGVFFFWMLCAFGWKKFIPSPNQSTVPEIFAFVHASLALPPRIDYQMPRVLVQNLNEPATGQESLLRYFGSNLWGLCFAKWRRILLDTTARHDILVHECVHYAQEMCGTQAHTEKEKEDEAWTVTELYMLVNHPWRYAFLTNICGLFGFVGFWGEVEIT